MITQRFTPTTLSRMKQHVKHIFLMTLLLFFTEIVSAFGQQLRFHVKNFALTQSDLTARSDQYKKIDGSGSLYAIIKVSGEEGDKLSEYQFNFGNMNHIVEEHDGLLWIYVQKNAKRVSISRSGYLPLRNYDLRTTIEAGKTYVMHLSMLKPASKRIAGNVSVITTPRGASVNVDGKDYGVTPCNIPDMPVGQHTVMLSLDGYLDVSTSVEVKENETAELNISLDDLDTSYQKAFTLIRSQAYLQAVELLQKLSSQGYPEAQLYLGLCYKNGLGVEKNLQKAAFWGKKAFDIISAQANKGDAKAQLNLGIFYANGLVVSQDLRNAVNWYVKSANQGYSMAQATLGEYYERGVLVEKDLQKAFFWYEKAANQGHPIAQYNLYRLYLFGMGVEKDVQKAISWLVKAANLGLAEAQHDLGHYYQNGVGLEKDYQKAFYWYEKAVNQGNGNAQVSMGFLYQNGLGVEKDYQKALYFYEKAANQGNATAQNNLRACYENGELVEKDLQKAAYWKKKYEENPNK